MPIRASDFVHLHVHSEFSLLDGANRIGPLVDYVKQLGMPAVALTDHGVMFGVHEFQKACAKAEIKPIAGCEVYITAGDRRARSPSQNGRNYNHLLLLAENYQGYKNLMKLSTLGHTEGYYYKPRVDFELLEQYSEGVVATTSCLAGLIPQALLNGREKQAAEMTGRFVELFGRERFFVEIQDHGLTEQHTVNAGLLRIAEQQNLKLIATNDCHYMRPEDATMHDILLCVQTGCCVNDANRPLKFDTNEFYVKSTEEMAHLFRHIPEAVTNTRLVAEICNLEMPPKEYHLPKFPCPDGMTEKEYLPVRVREGARERYGARADEDEDLRKRIEFELGVIENMGFSAYFLIVADFIDYARQTGIPVGPGRGSAAGSVVAYCLGITQLCPLRHGLLFERFLNPDRATMPDIDIDFCFERRGEVIEYVRRKYGAECVAQIVTFGTMKAKAAVRDVGRALGVELPRVDRVAKMIPDGPKVTLETAVQENEELARLVDSDRELGRLYGTARKIEGMVRHASTHAAGVVIADRDLTEYIPLYRSPKEDVVATQFNMTEVEELGLLKMDFLGIKNLTIIHRVEKWLRERDGIEIDWAALDYKDKKTYENLHRGQTAGVFQLESGGMTALVKALKPTEFADLTALLALYRPGPLKADMHMMYVKRKHGQERVVYDHPKLEPILKESYGIFLYQEQVMRVAMELCGFTRGEADVLRKAMGKKQEDVMARMEEKFIRGAAEHSGVEEGLARHIWDQIVTFAGYGFNKSHSAAYAVITFETAYLRANYPAYFQAALLTNEIGGSTDNIAKYVTNAREIGIDVLPADVNRSLSYFNPDGNRIWYAMGAVKTVGEKLVETIIAEREKNGPFRSFQDFIFRIPHNAINSRMVEALIKVGAFDSLHTNRHALLVALPELLEMARQREQSQSEADFFAVGGEEESFFEEQPLPDVPDWEDKTRANYEKEFLGFFLTEHPLNKYRVEMASFRHVGSSQLSEMAEKLVGEDTVDVMVLGCITNVMIRHSRNGRPFAIVAMEDLEGSFEVKLFGKNFEKFRGELEQDRVVQVRARLGVWQNRPSLDVFDMRPAEELRDQASGVELEFSPAELTEDTFRELREVCRRFGGNRQLRVRLRHPQCGEVELRLNGDLRVKLTEPVLNDLERIPGRPVIRFY